MMIDVDQKTLFVIESPVKRDWFLKQIRQFAGDGHCVATRGLLFNLPDTGHAQFGNIGQWIACHPQWLKTVVDSVGEANKVVLATDADNGGELIASQVAALCSAGKPIYRMRLHALTEREFFRALNDTEPFVHRSDYAFAQRYFDYLVFERCAQGGHPVPVGGVISPLLHVIDTQASPHHVVKGWRDGWHVSGVVDPDALLPTNFSLESGDAVRSPEAPSFLNHGGLVRAAYHDYGMEPAQTAKLAQELFEDGLITYTRTGSTSASSERMGDAVICGLELGLRLRVPESGSLQRFAHEAILPVELPVAMLLRCMESEPGEKLQVLRVVLSRALGQLYRATHPTTIQRSVVSGLVFEKEHVNQTGHVIHPATGLPLDHPLNPDRQPLVKQQMSKEFYLATQAERLRLGAPGIYATAASKAGRLVRDNWQLSDFGRQALQVCAQKAPGLLEPTIRENIKLVLADAKRPLSERLCASLTSVGITPPDSLAGATLDRQVDPIRATAGLTR